MPNEIYVLDTCAIIDLHNHFPTEFRKMIEVFAKENSLKIPEGVFRELYRKTDKICKKIKKIIEKYPSIIVNLRENLRIMEKFSEIERNYGESIRFRNNVYKGYWKSPRGKKSAEGQVIAIAKVLQYTVVSDDSSVKLICMLEDIPCIGWTEFARRSSKQLLLFNNT
ncbi:MAG: DUF4411 family protein [candidate division WOR-3 bacterium]